MPLRVAFISVVPSPYQRDLFGALATRPGIALEVFYLEAAAPDSPWPEKALESYESIIPGSWFSLGHARFHYNRPLPDLGGFDIVVLNIPVNALTTQWLIRFGLRGKRWIFWGERLRPRNSGVAAWLHGLMIKPLRDATAIVGVGTLAMEDYRGRFPGTRHFSIAYHCDLEGFLKKNAHDHEGTETVFLCCGQMIARKGLDILLEAFARLVAVNAGVRLLLVGREAELPGMLQPLPVAVREKISYEGFQPPEMLPEFFARADVFVLPSRYDGWGVVVNQALGAGLGVICSDAVGAGHDLVEPGVNGLRFPSEDTNALFESLKTAAADPAAVRKWGLASRAKAGGLSPEAGAEKWDGVLQTVAKNP